MAQANRELQPGEHVSWNYGAGQAKGQVVEKLTENKKLGARVFKASPDDPKYLVKSDTSGKEAIKKPETLHKLDEDSGAKSAGEARKNEGGAKEKRDHLKARSSSEERKEAESEEKSKKVQDTGKGSVQESAKAAKSKIQSEESSKKGQDTGKGSVRESAKAAKSKIKDAKTGDDALVEDEGEERDGTYEPKKDELEVPDDTEAIDTLPTDEEVLAQAGQEAKEEGVKAMDAVVADIGADEGEADDRTYEPEEEEEVVPEPVEEDEVINALPPDEELINQVEKENKELPDAAEASAGGESKQKSSSAPTKKKRS